MLQDLPQGTSVERLIKNAVRGYSPKARLDMVMKVIGMGLEAEERLQDVIVDAWALVLQEEWWRASYKSLEIFKEESGVAESVAEVTQRRNRTATLKRQFSALAAKRWGVADLETLLGQELMPNPAGKGFLEAMQVLSKRVPDAEEAVKMLTVARNNRLGRRGRTNRDKSLLLQDVRTVSNTLKTIANIKVISDTKLEKRQKKHRPAIQYHDALVNSDSCSDWESGQDPVQCID